MAQEMQNLYIHQHPNGPRLEWRPEDLIVGLARVRFLQGRLIGRMESLGFRPAQDAMLETLTGDVVKSSEIEGEILHVEQVRSSVARRLGLDYAGLLPPETSVDGVVEMMLDATQNYNQPLTFERLFGWHSSLFPTGRSGMAHITVGSWREDSLGDMQAVSGAIGGDRVHYEAPPTTRLDMEMHTFVDWFNAPTDSDPVLKAGLAHLWFVNIHPFDDGNGRIARAIGDMALAQSEGTHKRFYSMSSQIRKEHNDYYRILERTGKGNTDVTPWMIWFLDCLGRAIERAEDNLASVLIKSRFWERVAEFPINERQKKVINILLGDFQGNLTTSRWAKITNSSDDTALRDITTLVDYGILARSVEGGRSTHYNLIIDL